MISNLINIRETNNFSQEEISKILNTSQSNYSRWETGKEYIPLKKLNKLCNYFKVSMDYVMGISKINTFKTASNLDSKILGNNIKKLREEQNITQEELAHILNTTQSTISAYENGETIILTIFALQLVKMYNLSLDKLCGRK